MENLAEFVDRGDLCYGELAYDIRLMEVTPMLQLWQRYRVALIIFLLFITALLSLGAVLPSMQPLQQAKELLVDRISRVTGAQLSIAEVDITATGKVWLSDIQVAQVSDNAQVTAKARDILIGLNFWRLLSTRDWVRSISSVHVRELQIDAFGELDQLEELLPPRESTSGAFALPFPVTLSNITVAWQGYTWKEQQVNLSMQAKSGLMRFSLVRSSLIGKDIPAGYTLAGNGVLSSEGIQQAMLTLSQGSRSGTVTLAGALGWGADSGWQLKVSGKNVRLTPWLAEDLVRPFGLEATVTGPFRAPEIVVTTSTITGHDWQVDRLQAELALTDFSTVQLKSLAVVKKPATLTLSGIIPLTALDQAKLSVKGVDISTATLPQWMQALPFTGVASVTAQVHGLAPGWWIDGNAIVRQAALFGNAFTTLQAQLRIDAQQVAITAGTAYIAGVRDPAYRFSGEYKVVEQYLDVNILAAGIPAQHALAWPQLNWHAQGTLNGEVRIIGPISQPTFRVIATAPSGEFWHQPFRRLYLDLEYVAGVTTLHRTTAETADGEVTLNGFVHDGNVDLAFSVTDAALEKAVQAGLVHAEHYAPGGIAPLQQIIHLAPTGQVSAQGVIKGNSVAPRLTAEFTTTQTRLVGVTAGNWSGQVTGLVTGKPGIEPWRLTNGKVRLGNGTLTLSGAWVMEPAAGATQTLSLTGSVADLPLGLATQLGQAINKKLGGVDLSQLALLDTGTVDGAWSLNLPHLKVVIPRLTADLKFKGKLAGFDYQAQISGYGWRNDVQLKQIRITAAGGTAELQGAVVNNDLQITGNWTNLPAGIIATLAGVPQPVGGILSGDIDVRSTQGQIQGTLTWRTPQISVENSQLKQASGRIVATNGRLQLTQWQGTLGERPIQLSGSLPIPSGWGRYFGANAAQHLDISVLIPQGPLGPLVSWLQLVPALRNGATILNGMQAQGELQLHIGGTLQAPLFSGSAKLAQGVLPLPPPWGSAEQISGQLEFTGNSIRLVQASARVLGGQVTAQGEVTLKPGTMATLKGTLSANLQPKIAGISGESKLNLQISGTLAHPVLSGKAQVTKADIDLTNLPAIALSSATGADIGGFNGNGNEKQKQGTTLGFNIDIAIDQVRVRAASLLDVPAKGNLQLGGTLNEPRLNGVLRAERGRINYLGTFFTVEEGSATFAGYQGLMPNINLVGTTWVGNTTVALQVRGILPQLQFSFASEPYRSQADIVAMLGWPNQIGKVGSGNPNIMAQGIVEALQGGIELGLVSGLEETVRASLGLDEFRIHPSLAERRVRLSFGKYLLPRIYLTYETGLFGEDHQDLNLEYQLDNGWKVSAGVRDDGEIRFGVETKVRF
jgi:hypothetical protein